MPCNLWAMNKSSLFIAIIGAVAFFKGISMQYDADAETRRPTADSEAVGVGARTGYKPSLHKNAGFGSAVVEEQRSDTANNLNSNVTEGQVVEGSEEVTQVASLQDDQKVFEDQKGHLNQLLLEGNTEAALQNAQEFLNREVIAAKDTSRVAYFINFYLSNQEDDDTELRVVTEALEKSADPNVRYFLYNEYRSKAGPDLSQDLDQSLQDIGLNVNL